MSTEGHNHTASFKIRQSAKSYGKCSCCGERWIKDEGMYILKFEDAKDEKVCKGCARDLEYVEEVTQDEYTRLVEQEMENESMNRHERQMEDYGSYRAAGCESEYWEDLDAGFAS